MFRTKLLPKFGTNLIAALAQLKSNDFTGHDYKKKYPKSEWNQLVEKKVDGKDIYYLLSLNSGLCLATRHSKCCGTDGSVIFESASCSHLQQKAPLSLQVNIVQ
jgi:hypothetical protein